MAKYKLKFLFSIILCFNLTVNFNCTTEIESLPSFSGLEKQEKLPNPLVMRDGSVVSTAEVWKTRRRPEIIKLFNHYVYGYMPDAPENVRAELERIDRNYFAGMATKKEITLHFGSESAPPINLLLVIPNKRSGPAPVFLGLNRYANHSTLNDPEIPLSTLWMSDRGIGVRDNKATEESRGSDIVRWGVGIEKSIRQGYAVATFYRGDIDPDHDDFSDGIHPHYVTKGQPARSQHSWGTIAAWAWGLHRAVDYLVTDPDIAADKIAVLGQSRNGKASLLAGAMDERIALIISNQSGCGGAAISRRRVGETVKAINDRFPHWFNLEFRNFNDNENYLPVDQHMLISLIAPRPVLVLSAEEDTWADPEGEFLALKGADPVYRLLGTEGLQSESMPAANNLIDSVLGYHIRPGKHGMGEKDWAVFMDFADKHFLLTFSRDSAK